MDSSKSTKAESTATTAATKTKRTTGQAIELAAAASPPTLSQVRYSCLMNMDYHAAREAWLDRVHRWLMFIVIVAGASAFIDAWPDSRTWSALVSVVAGTLDLTFDLSNRARSHSVLRRRYAELLADASRALDQLSIMQGRLDELSGEEEPPYHAMMALSAMRAQEQTYGEVRDPCRPGLVYRMLANVIRFDDKDFNERSD